MADFLRQLSLDDEGRRKTEEEELRKRNADVLDAIGKLIDVTKAKAEEQRRKEEEAERQRLEKIQQERQRVFAYAHISLNDLARTRKARKGTRKA